MKLFVALLVIPLVASADVLPTNDWEPGFEIKKNGLGSGTPSRGFTEGVDVARPVDDQFFHVPGFLPGHPTAATLYPQVRSVDCTQIGEKFVCDGYQVNQAQGRGEYIYITPNVKYEPPIIEEPKIFKEPDPPKISKPKKPRKPRVAKPVVQCK